MIAYDFLLAFYSNCG